MGDLHLLEYSYSLYVHALKGKWFELSTPNLVDNECTAVTQCAMT